MLAKMMWKVLLFLGCVGLTVISCNSQDSDQCSGQNEYYDTCIQGCSNQTCDTIGKIFHCPIQTTVCKTGCRCNQNFYRNANNVCVSESECNSTSGSSVDINASNSQDSQDGDSISASDSSSDDYEEFGSRAVKSSSEQLESSSSYSSSSSSSSSSFSSSSLSSSESTSSSNSKSSSTRTANDLNNENSDDSDESASSSNSGSVSVGANTTAQSSACTNASKTKNSTTGCGGDPNATSGCGNNCGRTCSTYKNPRILQLCPRLQCTPSIDGCVCKDGYVFDSNVKKCVLPKECTPTCGLNEQYDSCTNGGCGHKNCSQLGQPEKCIKLNPESCIKGCSCVSGYLRADNGTCIPQDQCPAPGCGGDPNAHSGCGVNCGKTCSTYMAKSPICPRICKVGGCDCNDGFVFDGNVEKCVVSKQCTPICGFNEQYNSCTNGGCGYRNCSQVGQPQICIDRTLESCTKGCICADGYLRADNGTCIPQDQCPATGCGGDPNAQSGCGVNCGKTCSTYKDESPICPLFCRVGGCDCKNGFVFDGNLGKCVLRQECTPICGLNEQYSSCTNGGCGHRNCSQVGQPILCIDPIPGSCIKGCICADGYLRAANGTCVPQDQCPATGCGGDPNAAPGCGYNCGKTCTTYKAKRPLCPRIPCKRNGCDCKNGYVFDGNLKKCVLPKDCTNCNKPNEVYDVCPAPCPPRRCDVDDRLIRCAAPPQPGDPQCKPGCRCADGYARNATGTCVLRKQCEQPLTCDHPNEYYDSCPAPCPGESCDVDPAVVLCLPSPQYGDPECKPACRCLEGYARNANNKCVPRDKCPSKTQCTGQNEFFDTCISGCSNQTCETIGQIFNCPLQPAVCRTGCRCNPGFYRNASNVCVSESQCPSKTQCTGQNEFFDTCISGCSNQTCETIGQIFNCPLQPAVCRTGCRCNQGFYRNASNVCVSESQCPTPPCPDGEVYSRCPTVPCDGDYCPKTRDSPLTCPVGIVCDRPRCVCGLLNRRDRKTGKCINAATCPPFKCDRPNESYQSCPASCPGETCTDYINGSKCPPFRIGIVVPCKPQCKCNNGYYRNSTGICVLPSQCGSSNINTPNTPVTLPTPAPADDTGKAKENGQANLEAGVTRFNGEFLYDRMKANQGDNIIASPYSVFTPLAQLALYADGESFKQLISVLNLSSKDDIRNSFPALTASFDGQTSVNFSTAAKVYSNIQYPLSDGFKKDSVDVVHAGAQELDFSKNTEAAGIINDWVESQTNNRIKDLIQPSDLSALTRIVLVNAIYFKGDWLYSFNKNNTKDADFYLSDGTTKKTKLMYQKGNFRYGEIPDLDCTALEMLYKGKNFSMVFVLPNTKDDVLKTAENLQDETKFNQVLTSLRSQQVEVYVPPFEINTSTDLSDILQQVGVTKIFDQTGSGLSGILKKPEDTYVSKAIQKAFIKVDETGSEAAAANGAIGGRPGLPAPPPPPPKVFRADHSFLFYLRLQSTTIFCGAFNQ